MDQMALKIIDTLIRGFLLGCAITVVSYSLVSTIKGLATFVKECRPKGSNK